MVPKERKTSIDKAEKTGPPKDWKLKTVESLCSLSISSSLIHYKDVGIGVEEEASIPDQPLKKLLPVNASKSQKRNARKALAREAGSKQDGSDISLMGSAESRKRRAAGAAWRREWDEQFPGAASQNMSHRT